MAERTLFDFADPAAAEEWTAINDAVMGGVSTGSATATGHGNLLFSGTLSLEHGGGFASIRSPALHLDLGDCSGLVLRCRGDGRRYKMNLRIDAGFDGIAWQAAFATETGHWQEIALPFARFRPTYHGREQPGAGPLDPGRVQSLGLIIADRREEPFRLEIASIRALP